MLACMSGETLLRDVSMRRIRVTRTHRWVLAVYCGRPLGISNAGRRVSARSSAFLIRISSLYM